MLSNVEESYIESRLPLEEISIECQRERGASSALPQLYFLHVWWARRPLTACRAAVLGILLPSTASDKEFLTLLGIRGDPIAAQRASLEAKKNGKRLSSNPFDYPRAFTVNLDKTQLNTVADFAFKTLHSRTPVILDPMAGGGSIPFEVLRTGTRVLAGEYNPVAKIILEATIDFPTRFGLQLQAEIVNWARWVGERARNELYVLFPSQKNEVILDYIWARTIRCPACSLVIPLSPNWWLSRPKGKKQRVAVRLNPLKKGEGDTVNFEIVDMTQAVSLNPDKGTVDDGKVSCPRPRCGNTIPEDAVKREAQQGRMGHQLYAVLVRKRLGPKKWEKSFRLPIPEDLLAYNMASNIVDKQSFKGSDLVPKEQRFKGPADRSVAYGLTRWNEAFNARQLLTHSTYLYYLLEAKKRILAELGNTERANALIVYLSLIFDKCLNYNSILAAWNAQRAIVRSVFDRHDFGFSWSYGEMNSVPERFGGFDWALNQVVEAYAGVCKLLTNVSPDNVKVHLGTSTKLSYVDESVDGVIVDPPYYANVMYSELSDFFYVWMKHVLSDIYDGFETPLTDKDGEVVANPARFRGLGASADQKAKEDYRTKMAQTFKQIHRVLKPHGILVLMFTHKTTEAWDTLATALIDGGFQIRRSWPIRTEPEHSLHIARKNAAKSTIFLVARKRKSEENRGWWEQEIYPEIERIAETKAYEFEQRHINGVDLYISTFGPVLEVFSRYSEVKSLTGKTIQPEEALDVARKVVTNRTLQKLVPGGGSGIDEITKFYILAMHFYRARQFPFDEARKLAISVGIDASLLRDKHHIIRKKSEDVVILDAAEREHSGYIDLERPADKPLVDAIHLGELALQRGGMKQYQALIDRLNLDTNQDFRIALQALMEALPDADSEKRAIAPLFLQMPEQRAKGSRLEEYTTLGK